MLSETIEKWKAGWKRDGLREGRLEGRLKGRLEGHRKGHQEGQREGRERGRHEAEVAMLLRQLRARFGRLPAVTRQRVVDASSVQRKHWSTRLLKAQRLDKVFEEETRSQ